MSMLIKFKVKNFRSIKEEVIVDLQSTTDETRKESATFESADVSLIKSMAIYGANASGKSNILASLNSFKFMLMYSLNFTTNPLPLQHQYFKLDKDYKNKPTEFEIAFIMNHEVYLYGFSFNTDGVVREYLIREKGNVELFMRNYQEIKSHPTHLKESTKDLQNQTHPKALHMTLLNQNNGQFAKIFFQNLFKINYVDCINQKLDGQNLTTIYYLKNDENKKEVIDFMKIIDKTMDFEIKNDQKHITELPNIPKQMVDELSKQNNGLINISEISTFRPDKDGNIIKFDFLKEESEGTKQSYNLAGIMFDTLRNGGVLFLDEINSSLHPILCKYIVEIFNSNIKNPNNAQLIFTTHDTTLLDKDIMRRDQIYFTNKIKDGSTELFSLADISERKDGVNFAKRYLEGRYDAIPYIKELEDLIQEK